MRNRKLARRRRLDELVEHREEERIRQRAHRAKVAGRADDERRRHAPAAAHNDLKTQAKVALFVDRALAQSRASLLRDLAEFVPRQTDFLVDTG